MGIAPRPKHDHRGSTPSHALLALLLMVSPMAGCATTTPPTVESPTTRAKDASSTPAPDATVAEAPVAEAPDSGPETKAHGEASMPPPLPEQVDAGTIPRAALTQVLSAGIPRFLQRVPVERFPERGRFMGWRLLGLFQDQPEISENSVVKPGDVIVRVNRHSIERPEQFTTVWQSLAAGSEIVFDILRGDQPTRIRYLISDDNLGTAPLPQAATRADLGTRR